MSETPLPRVLLAGCQQTWVVGRPDGPQYIYGKRGDLDRAAWSAECVLVAAALGIVKEKHAGWFSTQYMVLPVKDPYMGLLGQALLLWVVRVDNMCRVWAYVTSHPVSQGDQWWETLCYRHHDKALWQTRNTPPFNELKTIETEEDRQAWEDLTEEVSEELAVAWWEEHRQTMERLCA